MSFSSGETVHGAGCTFLNVSLRLPQLASATAILHALQLARYRGSAPNHYCTDSVHKMVVVVGGSDAAAIFVYVDDRSNFT